MQLALHHTYSQPDEVGKFGEHFTECQLHTDAYKGGDLFTSAHCKYNRNAKSGDGALGNASIICNKQKVPTYKDKELKTETESEQYQWPTLHIQQLPIENLQFPQSARMTKLGQV